MSQTKPLPMPQASVLALEDPRQIQAFAQPIRVSVLEALREPGTAASVARATGTTRQQANYHVKALEKAGLIRHTGERRNGNFMEQLYQSLARRFIVAPNVGWNPETLARTLRDQVSLARLATLGSQVQADAAALTDQAAFEGREIASATVETETRFASAEARAAFLKDYVAMLQSLLDKHGADDGQVYKLAFAAYPHTEEK